MAFVGKRIDILGSEESVEEKSLELLQKLKSGEISVKDLMGPLFNATNMSPNVSIPVGEKIYSPVGPTCEFYPMDESNSLLVHHVHPHDYVNPFPTEEYDLVVIGAGVAGLLSVIQGKWLGKSCALIERHGMGGDCLNFGCVPSKALIACARAAHSVKSLSKFGVNLSESLVEIDFPYIMNRMREIRSKISHHDSVQRYGREFCKDVFVGEAVFLGGKEVQVTGIDGSTRVLRFKKAMVATGASPSVPPIPGLRDTPHLTNLNFFNLTNRPPRLLVIGCGPIGLELAQSMARLGTKVSCFESGPQLLPREDPDAAQILAEQLAEDGVNCFTGVRLLDISVTFPDPSTSPYPCMYSGESGWPLYRVRALIAGEERILEGEALLNATGRSPNVHDTGLERVGVEWDNRKGVHTNEFFQTTNPDIYACGDCASPFKFTHSADFQARLAIRNMFLGDTNKQSDLLVPWCTYTEPEIAHVGKYEKELQEEGVAFESFTKHFKDVDRGMCDGIERGFVKITIESGTHRILGGTVVGPSAGDMISEITLCIQHNIGIADLAGTIHPYPTLQESLRLASLGFYKYYKQPEGVALRTLKLLMDEREKGSETEKNT